MNLSPALLGASLALMIALPARAGYVQTDFSGTAYFSPTESSPITFDVVYDTSRLVNRTDSVKQALGANFPSSITSVLTASLADDPSASLLIKVGDITFTKFDEVNYGTPEGDGGPGADLGVGNFPAVTYLNGSFAGVGNLFINPQGYVLDADPIADALGGFGPYQFVLGKGDASNPFGNIFAAGFYDAADATITPFPEPTTWSLLIMGMAAAGLLMRCRRSKVGSTSGSRV